MKRIICHLIGHRCKPVMRVPGSQRYFSHPRGTRLGCSRCRTVMPKES